MQDEFLIREIEKNLEFLGSRGMATTAGSISMLIKRFQNLKEAHRLLSEREERLTTEVVALKRHAENSTPVTQEDADRAFNELPTCTIREGVERRTGHAMSNAEVAALALSSHQGNCK